MLRKIFLPWTARGQFPTEEAFQMFLRRHHKVTYTLRMIPLLPAAVLLMGGYLKNSRPLMLWTIVPLLAVLLLTVILTKTEAAFSSKS